ncbi:MAG TPA: DUF2516 family protein [Mycobacteriales bacterium]|jgi:hypothetical protein|nr:DUF2516 family protein [Mycobacteriales bacterium]
MSYLLFPLNGAFLVIGLAMLVVKVWALVDATTHPDAAYQAAGKLNKTAWIVILVIGLFFSLLGLIAALVYLLDVRPALRSLRRGGSSSSRW